jgi:hypothetical protein
MTPEITRRNLLQAIGIASCVPAIGGCVIGQEDGIRSGSLVIRNEDQAKHSVSYALTKVSQTEDRAPGPFSTKTPSGTPLEEREGRREISGGEEVVESDYISEPGTYFLTAELRSGDEDSGWVGLYEAANGGVAEEFFLIAISEDGDIDVTSTQTGA